MDKFGLKYHFRSSGPRDKDPYLPFPHSGQVGVSASPGPLARVFAPNSMGTRQQGSRHRPTDFAILALAGQPQRYALLFPRSSDAMHHFGAILLARTSEQRTFGWTVGEIERPVPSKTGP